MHLRDRLGASLATTAPRRLVVPGFRDAAVLVPIVERAGAATTLVFTVRPAAMPTHGGQISFPGGGREHGDTDAGATALREATEEIGVDPSGVEVLGMLDDVPTPLGFVI
ncbi:MAG: CoA pyrophosphatase, partial [Myxococcota bacterium]